MQKKVSSSDVAKEAGVSRATVSYILNNVEGIKIKPETRQKVQNAAKKLGYHPDYIARAMKTNKSMSIAVVSHRDITEERFVRVLGGIGKVLKQNKYNLILSSYSKDSWGNPEYYSLYKSKKVDGILFLSSHEEVKADCLNKVKKEKIPSVFIDYHIKDSDVCCVDIDYFDGGYKAAKYLIDKGHEKIKFLIPNIKTEQRRQRIKGVLHAFEYSTKAKCEIIDLGEDANLLEYNIKKALENKEDSTAFIISWIALAYQTLYLTNKMGIKVPEELAVVTLAGNNFANYCYPKLTTCDLPLYELGKKSAKLLLNNIQNEKKGVRMKIPCTLNIRESS